MINSVYGILKGPITIESDVAGYRYTDAKRTSKQNTQLAGLMPDSDKEAASFINYILQLLSCSPYWPQVVRELDPQNTYDVYLSNLSPLSFNPMQRLIHWELTSTPATHEKFKYSPEDPTIDRICAKLFAIIATGISDGTIQS